MDLNYAIVGDNIYKKYKGFTLDIPQLTIPQGFATALIGMIFPWIFVRAKSLH